jgi:hypothetical protein
MEHSLTGGPPPQKKNELLKSVYLTNLMVENFMGNLLFKLTIINILNKFEPIFDLNLQTSRLLAVTNAAPQ